MSCSFHLSQCFAAAGTLGTLKMLKLARLGRIVRLLKFKIFQAAGQLGQLGQMSFEKGDHVNHVGFEAINHHKPSHFDHHFGWYKPSPVMVLTIPCHGIMAGGNPTPLSSDRQTLSWDEFIGMTRGFLRNTSGTPDNSDLIIIFLTKMFYDMAIWWVYVSYCHLFSDTIQYTIPSILHFCLGLNTVFLVKNPAQNKIYIIYIYHIYHIYISYMSYISYMVS